MLISPASTLPLTDYLPPALLTLVSEKAVVNNNEAPSLQLLTREGVKDWECRVLRNDVETYFRTDKRFEETFQFHVEIKGATPEIVWCKKKKTKGQHTVRSNSVIFRSSGNETNEWFC